MRTLAFASSLATLAACVTSPELAIWEPFTSHQEYEAQINSSWFREGGIYDCAFTPVDPASPWAGTVQRQLIYDEDGLPNIAYCEPGRTDRLACFHRSILGTAEVFDLHGYKTITIETDGTSRLIFHEPQYDPESHEVTAIIDTELAGTCRPGPAYPSGVVAPQYQP